MTFSYDSGGRRTVERWINVGGSVARRITYTYDAADQLTAVTDPDATLTFTYDSGGRLLTARTSGGGTGQPDITLTYGTNALGERTSLTDNLASVGRTTYVYDAAHRLTTITRSLGGTEKTWVKFGYDDADRRTSVERSVNGTGTKITTALAYDNADRLTTIQHAVSGGAALATFVYGYDSGGRVTTESNAEGLATYSYDDTNQLTGVDRPGSSNDESFGYDAAGNRNTTGYTTISGNRMTASPGYTYTYDAEGNRSAQTQLNGPGTNDDVVTTYAYDHRNRLVGVTEKTGGTLTMQATYAYDALGRRIRTRVDDDGAGPHAAVTTWTAYDGKNPYADFNGSGTLAVRYLHGRAIDELLARTESGGTSAWYLPDRLGSVRDIVSTAGTVVYHAAYAAFGTITSETGTGDRFTFTGRERNAETGDFYVRARHYDPRAGRFTSIDPIGFAGQDVNLWRYVRNSPTSFNDPYGLRINIETGLPGSQQEKYADEIKKMIERMKKESDEFKAFYETLEKDDRLLVLFPEIVIPDPSTPIAEHKLGVYDERDILTFHLNDMEFQQEKYRDLLLREAIAHELMHAYIHWNRRNSEGYRDPRFNDPQANTDDAYRQREYGRSLEYINQRFRTTNQEILRRRDERFKKAYMDLNRKAMEAVQRWAGGTPVNNY